MRKPSLQVLLLSLFSLAIAFLACAESTSSQDLDVPYVPTPQVVVERMLELAGVGIGDYVIDLGSGDGRIVITAAAMGANGHGVDLDPERVREARENALRSGVAHQVMFLEQNIFATDFSKASVITMYLFPSINMQLRPKLLEQLRPGTRIVSHSFDLDDWQPDRYETVDVNGDTHSIFLWICPVQMEGRWEWSFDGRRLTMDVKQTFQDVELNVRAGDRELETSRTHLRGRKFTFAMAMDGTDFLYTGHVEGNQISGMVQIRQRDTRRLADWTAGKIEPRP